MRLFFHIVPEMTYKVSSGILSLFSLTSFINSTFVQEMFLSNSVSTLHFAYSTDPASNRDHQYIKSRISLDVSDTRTEASRSD